MTGLPRNPADDPERLSAEPNDLVDWVTEGFDADPADPAAGAVGGA